MARLLKRLERPALSMAPAPSPARAGDFVIEASPLASFDTAAGHFTTTTEVDVPPEVWDSYRGNLRSSASLVNMLVKDCHCSTMISSNACAVRLKPI